MTKSSSSSPSHAQQSEALDSAHAKCVSINTKNIDTLLPLLFSETSSAWIILENASAKNDLPGDYRFIAVNPAFERMAGPGSQNIIGRNIREVIPTFDPEWLARYDSAVRSGQADIFELPNQVFGKHFEVQVYRLNSQYCACIFWDVTERFIVARKVRDNEAKYQSIIKNASDAIYINDLNGYLLECNDAACRMTGYSREELIGRTLAKIDSSDDAQQRAERIAMLLSNEMILFEGTHVHKDGHQISVEISAKLILESGKKEVLSFVRDITARKRTEEALRDSESKFRFFIESIKDVIWTLDVETLCFTYVSPTVKAQRGYTAQEVMAQPFEASLAPDAVLKMRKLMATKIPEFVASEKAGITIFHTEEVQQPCKDGTLVWSEIVTRLTRNIKTGRLEIQGVTRDITERKRAQDALIHAQAVAEASRQKDHFIAVLSHELRNPLAPIRNSVALLRKVSSPDPILARARELIDRQVTHMTRLVDDLLDVSRVANGKITLSQCVFDIVAVVADVIEDYRPLIMANGITLGFSAPSAVYAHGDSARVAQIVGNLLTNANKFTPQKGQITVALNTREDRNIEISVRDTGIGMEPQTLASLFIPFSQASHSINQSKGGLGLGLALVKALTELHGGVVKAASSGLNQGSEFSVVLPIRIPALAEMQSNECAAPSAKSRRVLIIEDNVDSADSLQMLLDVLGHSVMVAYSGPEGIQRARTHKPEMILCDIGLPGEMDGFAVARTLRADPEFRSTLLVALSGYGQAEDKRRAISSGFDHHLTKPAEPDTLMRLLNTLA